MYTRVNLRVRLFSCAISALFHQLQLQCVRNHALIAQEMRRAELEFKTPIDAKHSESPETWDPRALRQGNMSWNHAAWDYFARFDHLAFLVLQKRIDDQAMLVLIKRKLVHAFGQMETYAPDWVEAEHFPYFKELFNTYS